MKSLALACILLLTGCASFERWAQSVIPEEVEPECNPKYEICEPETIIVEATPEQLLHFCGLWSGTSGCVWGNHKFVLKQETMTL
jgi:hypothetical protein